MKINALSQLTPQHVMQYIAYDDVPNQNSIYKCPADRPCIIVKSENELDKCPYCIEHTPVLNDTCITVTCSAEGHEFVPYSRIDDDNGGFICPWCGDQYADAWELPLKKDGDETEYECDECGKTFHISLQITCTYTSKVLDLWERIRRHNYDTKDPSRPREV